MKPLNELTKIPFPDCYNQCALAHALGVSECDDTCPDKFDDKGDPINTQTKGMKDEKI